MSTGPKKIPSHCPLCGEALTSREMAAFLDRCEKSGTDPLELALSRKPPGVVCISCFCATVAEGAEDGDPAARRLVSQMRVVALGIEELPDGKPVQWH
jgi:hypothetical protein